MFCLYSQVSLFKAEETSINCFLFKNYKHIYSKDIYHV